jgi:secreted trypsin-like serine protease
MCTATLINRDHVLTAAHCVARSQVSDILLIAGSYDPLSISESPKNFRKQQWRTVQQVFIHPRFDSLNLNNDIAILRVNASFVFNQYVQPACLPSVDAKLHDEVIMVGWGAATYGGRTSETLKQAYTRVVGSCDTYWPTADDLQQICVANALTGSSTCSGDSGGPLLFLHRERYVVLGISSFSGACNTRGNDTLPNIYTRVTAYSSWIQTITTGTSHLPT